MRHSSLHYLLTLFTSGLLAAGAQGDPPAAREKDAPKTWKLTELNAMLPNAADRGLVTVLVWEVVEFDGVFATEERCLVVKRYAAPTAAGRVCVVGVLSRLPGGRPPSWEANTTRELNALPTDKELEALLEEHGWHTELKPKTLALRIGGAPSGAVRYVPRVTDGGVCGAAWKTALKRPAPHPLFPELAPAPKPPSQGRPRK
ncbi:MAG TPA: hypothetical protein VGE74_10700 [Gemmata sp.]